MTTSPSESAERAPVVLIHGMWMTPRSWEHWIKRYGDRGHQVLAPAWPGLEGEPEELRRDPSPLTKLGITEVIDHYDRIIRALDRPPIIIGHSFGGLFTQLLIDRGLGLRPWPWVPPRRKACSSSRTRPSGLAGPR